MLRSYLPAIVFLVLGGAVGVAFGALNSVIGPRREARQKQDPYECGLPSEVTRGMRFALIESIVFIVLLLVALVYVWRRGALEWR